MLVALCLNLLLAETPTQNPRVPDGIANPTPSTQVEAPTTPKTIHNPQDEALVDKLAAETLASEESNVDPLEYSQKERQAEFQGGIALNLGPVMPWSEYGGSILWTGRGVIQSGSIGGGNFEFSDNYRGRNYKVKVDSQSAYYAARWFFLGFGPLYVEPFAGLVRWSGSIKPSGFDDVSDSLASSLNSRFDMSGASIGANLGVMWIFSNGLFLDYNLFSLSSAAFLTSSFTTNSEEAKKNVRKELAGPLSTSNLQLRVGWSMKL